MNSFNPHYSTLLNLDNEIEELLIHQRYGVEYQPIVCTKTGEIFAYEALARFYLANGNSIPPVTVFELLHNDLALFSQVEFDLKKLQVNNAPRNYDVFVNLDPHAVVNIDDLENSDIMQFLIQQKNITVELIENTNLHDAQDCTALHHFLKQHQITTALDDIGASNSLISLDLLPLVDCLKYDRSWFSKLRNKTNQQLFSTLIEFSKQSGKMTILEGIETDTMLAIAQHFSIKYVQGFLYRPLFQNTMP